MKNTLFKLDLFCCKNNIEFGVTGTCALSLLGVPLSSEPKDIDILLFHVTDETRAKLKELQFLAGFSSKEYETGECYSFLIDGVKINAIVDGRSHVAIARDFITLILIDEERARRHSITVQRVDQAIHAKMALGRPKDSAFLLDLINRISTRP